MSYVDEIAASIRQLIPPTLIPDGDTGALFRIYAVLALAKGERVVLEDVHDAWAAWMSNENPQHRSLKPLAELASDVQESDRPYLNAIHAVARDHKLGRLASSHGAEGVGERKRGAGPSLDQIRSKLWNDGISAGCYAGDAEKYQTAILEQYKIYVEMADRVSNRRGLTNTFFLTLNTAVFTLFGVLWNDHVARISTLALVPLLIAALGECGTWWFVVRSYRQLNTGKYKVIGLLEERLPASPYWSAEWQALREGKDFWVYVPLTRAEQVVPVLFAAIYLLGFILAATR